MFASYLVIPGGSAGIPTNNSIQEKQHKYRSEIALIANAYPKLYREEPDHSRFRWNLC